jgi:hypothetical protein
MKHFILVAIVLCMSFMSKAQYTTVNQPKVDNAAYKELKHKSSNAKVEAVILNVTGIALCAGGTIVWVFAEIDKSSKSSDGYADDDNGFLGKGVNDDNLINTGIAMTAGGVVLGIGSAVLYTRSSILYHKAREIKMSMNTNSVNIPVSGIQTNRLHQVGVGVSISL